MTRLIGDLGFPLPRSRSSTFLYVFVGGVDQVARLLSRKRHAGLFNCVGWYLDYVGGLPIAYAIGWHRSALAAKAGAGGEPANVVRAASGLRDRRL